MLNYKKHLDTKAGKEEPIAMLGVRIPLKLKNRVKTKVRRQRPRMKLQALVVALLAGWVEEK